MRCNSTSSNYTRQTCRTLISVCACVCLHRCLGYVALWAGAVCRHVVYVSMCQQARFHCLCLIGLRPCQRANLCGAVFQNHPGPKCLKPQSFPNSPYASQWVSQKSKFWDNLKQHLLLQHRNPLKLDLTCFRMHGYFAVSADGYLLGLGVAQIQQHFMCLTLDLARNTCNIGTKWQTNTP